LPPLRARRQSNVYVSRASSPGDLAPRIPRPRRDGRAQAMTIDADTRQEPAPAPEAAPFHFAPTFKLDLAFSLAYVVLFIRLWARVEHDVGVCAGAIAFGILLALCYAGKVYIIGFLNQRGGDARTYVISSDLVTTGLYAYSRNPTYFLTFVQTLVWSAFLLFLQAVSSFDRIDLAAALLLPVGFFLVHDRWIIAREDAALRAAHPQAFDAYAATVGRWIGRKRGAPAP
jgi:protein-S-isoprenylcysteine O-methyltransferase Ste14